MAQPLTLSIGVNIDAAGAKTGGVEAQQAVAGIGNEAQRTQTKLQALINATIGLNTGAANGNLKEWSGALAMQGRSADELRAKYNPLFAVIRSYKQQLTEIRTLHAQGVLSSNEMAAAISRERQATLASIEAIKGRGAALSAAAANGRAARSSTAGGTGAGAFQTANVAAQFQDIAVTSAMGMSPVQIALQQGTQLAAVIGTMERPTAGLLTAFRSLISVQSLVTIGAVAASAAAIQWLTSSRKEVRTLDDALAAHKENIETLTARYGALGEAVKISGNLGGSVFGDASLRQNESLIRAVARRQNDEMLAKLAGVDGVKGYFTGPGASVEDLQKLSGPLAAFKSDVDSLLESARRGAPDLATFQKSVERTFATLVQTSDNPEELRRTADAILALGDSALSVDPKFKPFENAINRLKVQLADGRPDLSQFHAEVERIGRTNGLQKIADEVITFGKEVLNLNKLLAELALLYRRAFDDRGPNGLLLSQGTTNRGDMGNLALYENRQRIQLERNRKAFDAEIAALGARSPQEKSAIARQTAAADIRDESVSERRQRIELAGARALAQAEKELADARRDRIRSMTEAVEGQQLELTLIGKTAGEAERLRMEHRLTAQARAEAAKNGVEVDQEELRLIAEKSRAYGQLAEQIAATNMIRDQQSQAHALETELQLVGAGEIARRRALSALQAEQELKQRGVDLESDLGRAYKRNAEILTEGTIALERHTDAWNRYRSAGESAIDTIVDGLGNLEKPADILKSLAGGLGDFALETMVKNPLKNAIFGTNYGTLADLASGKTGGDLASSIFGQGVGAMTVNAATVMLNGAVGILGSLTAANDNAGQSLFGQAFKSAGLTKTGVPLSEVATGSGLSASVASAYAPRFQGLLNDLKAAGYNVTSLGEGGYSWRNVSGTDNLSRHAFGEAIDINPRSNPWSDRLQTDLPSNINDIATRNGLTWGGNWNKPDTMHFQVDKSINDAALALDKVSDSASGVTGSIGALGNGLGAAGNGLNQFGLNLGQFGQTLQSALAGGNNGLASLLGSFTNFGISAFNASPQFASAVLSGSVGLWDRGGWTGSGGKFEPAGIVHREEFVFSKEATRAIGVGNLDAMHKAAIRGKGFAAGGYAGQSVTRPAAYWPSSANGNAPAPATASTSPALPSISVYVDNPRGDRDIEDAIDRGVARGIRQYRKHLGADVERVNRRPKVRGQLR